MLDGLSPETPPGHGIFITIDTFISERIQRSLKNGASVTDDTFEDLLIAMNEAGPSDY